MKAAAVGREELDQAFGAFRGELHRPGDPRYDDARHIWNTMFADARPVLIARCLGMADVQDVVHFARESGRPLAVRGGGHSIAGKSTVDGGVVLDLTLMNHARIDADAKRAFVEGGATWGDYDREAQAFGLASPAGALSMTGVGGVTLGGGFGWLVRPFGLACDNVRSMDVVLASGECVTCDENRHPDLFWGLRGGGGNFGVVTSFEFELHDVGADVLTGVVGWPVDQAAAFLDFYAQIAADLPRHMGLNAQLVTAPPIDEIPASLHGETIMILIFCWSGADHDEGLRAIEPIRSFGTPAFDTTGVMSYTDLQKSNDMRVPSCRSYWQCGWIDDFRPAIDALVEHQQKAPTALGIVELLTMSGAIADLGDEDSAFTRRSGWVYNIIAMWEDEAGDNANLTWAREFHEALVPHASEGAYINFFSNGDDVRIPEAYKPQKLARLAQIKRTYDPDNLFRINHNIAPAAQMADSAA